MISVKRQGISLPFINTCHFAVIEYKTQTMPVHLESAMLAMRILIKKIT